MPGESRSEDPWGQRPLLVDTSAWARAHHPEVREIWQEALIADRFRLSPVVRLELLFSARDGESFDRLTGELAAIRPAPMTLSVLRIAEAAMRSLAHRSAGAQRIPVVDSLVAAAAQEISAAVLHYDSDFDTLAEVLDFDSYWMSAPGSVP